jgi:hypothetical protein
MTVAHYRIYELDPTDQVMDGYSVMCRSDAAALAMASNCAENRLRSRCGRAAGTLPALTP